MRMKMYVYKAVVTRVIDGDTIDCDVDLGFYIHLKKIRFRLLGIDAPEMYGMTRMAGWESKEFLREQIEGKEVMIQTDKDDSFGRWLAYIYLDDVNINDLMIERGYAVPYGR
jgi:micrococcal nuclease